MSLYLEKGKELLRILTKNGCEAYIIGEASRSVVMDKEPTEVEIVTSATPGMIRGIFLNFKIEEIDDTSLKVNYEDYDFYISSFRNNTVKNQKRRQTKDVYSKKLDDELANRLMTCDAIAMSSGGKFTDAYNGFKDIKHKKIKAIANVSRLLVARPKDVFKVINVYGETGFEVDKKLQKGCKEASKKFVNLSPKDYMDEIAKTLNTKYYKKALSFYKFLNVKRKLSVVGLELNRLHKKPIRETMDDFLINAMVLSGEVQEDLASYFSDEVFCKSVVNLALASPKSIYDDLLLFNYGLDVCIKANLVNNTLGRSSKKTRQIRKKFNRLPIKKPCDLEFKGDDLMKISEYNGPEITEVMEDVILKVITKELPNERDVLTSYATKLLQEKDVMKPVEEVKSYSIDDGEIKTPISTEKFPTNDSRYDRERIVEEPEVEIIEPSKRSYEPMRQYDNNRYYNDPYQSNPYYQSNAYQVARVQNDFDEYKYQSLQRELAEVRRMVSEKDEKINSLQKATKIVKFNTEVETLLNQNMASLEEINYFQSETDRILYKQEQRKIYQNMLLRKPEYYGITKEDIEHEKN